VVRTLPPLEPTLIEKAEEEPSAKQARLDRARQDFLRACRRAVLELGLDEAKRLLAWAVPGQGRPRGPKDHDRDRALLAEYDSIAGSASSEVERKTLVRRAVEAHPEAVENQAAGEKHLRRLLRQRKENEEFHRRVMDAAPEGATLLEAVCLWYGSSTDIK
jgi:hypothetical protein